MTERQRPKPSPSTERRKTPRMAIADRVHGILSTKSLTLYKVAALSRANYPKQINYHIPRNLYFQLHSGTWSPTIQQMVALSQLTGYRLADWLGVFGFRLDDVSRLQASLHQPRTSLLDSSLYDPRSRIPWFRDRTTTADTPFVAPLSQLLESSHSEPLSELVAKGLSPYLYAKIGRRDAYAFPDLAPGSIVRVDTRLTGPIARKSNTEISKRIFLVEHSRGLCCCRLHFGPRNRITLIATQLPFAGVELQLVSEARILGIVDMELRPLTNPERSAIARCTPPEVAPDLTRLWTPAPLHSGFTTREPTFLVRSARRRMGLSLREASEMSLEIARTLGDRRYFASSGSLSEYEATPTPPRHIHKLLTLCILYSIRFEELLQWFGLQLETSQVAAIPGEWITQAAKSPAENLMAIPPGTRSSAGFLPTLLGRLGEVPFFLRLSFPSLSGLPDISLRDVFWVGGHRDVIHPYLIGALFIIVDRRMRRPRIFPLKTAWEQPIYLLRKRDGSYLLASCGMENGTIVVHPYTDNFVSPQRLQKGVDVEILGQIVTVVRSLPSLP
jgi:hypothetical protein